MATTGRPRQPSRIDVEPADLTYACRVARKAAYSFRRHWTRDDLEDLDQEARIACWTARQCYDPTRGAAWPSWLHLHVWSRTYNWCRWWSRQNRLPTETLDDDHDQADTVTQAVPADPDARAQIVSALGGHDGQRWSRSLGDVADDLGVSYESVRRMRTAVAVGE